MRLKSILPQLALLAASLLLALLCGEVALRFLLGPPVVWKYPQEYYVFDPEIGHRLRPQQEAFTHDAPLRVNDRGIRGDDAPRTPAVGSRRLLALGDSQTFGSGLVLSDTWPKRLESRLLEVDPGSRWEVLNAGLTASDTWQHEVLLERLADVYEFEGVVLGFYVNDVSPGPRRAPRKLSRAARTNTWSKRLGYLAKRSAVFTAAWQAKGPLQAWWSGDTSVVDRERHLLSGEPDPDLEVAWQQVERSLGAMARKARELGVDLVVLVLPRRDQVSGGTPGTAYQKRVGEIASRFGIVSVDLLPALREAYGEFGSELFIPWDGHNSAVANRIIAEHAAPAILAASAAAVGDEPARVGDGA